MVLAGFGALAFAHVKPQISMRKRDIDRPAAPDDHAAGGPAEHPQTDDVLALLSQICRRTNLRIDMYHRATALADADGHLERAGCFRHLIQIEELDRQILERLIDQIRRESPPRSRDEV